MKDEHAAPIYLAIFALPNTGEQHACMQLPGEHSGRGVGKEVYLRTLFRVRIGLGMQMGLQVTLVMHKNSIGMLPQNSLSCAWVYRA